MKTSKWSKFIRKGPSMLFAVLLLLWLAAYSTFDFISHIDNMTSVSVVTVAVISALLLGLIISAIILFTATWDDLFVQPDKETDQADDDF